MDGITLRTRYTRLPARERKLQIYVDNALGTESGATNLAGAPNLQPDVPVTDQATNALDAVDGTKTTVKKLNRLRSAASFIQMSTSEMELKANIYYHISNPLKRWKTDRSPPVMLMLQVAVTICVVAQIIFFMNSSVNRQSMQLTSAEHLFACLLLDKCSRDADIGSVYPVYSIEEIEDILNNSGVQYSNFANSVAYGFDCARTDTGDLHPVQVTLTQYAMLDFTAVPYVLNDTYETISFQLDPTNDIIGQMNRYSDDPLYSRFVAMDITYYFNTIQITQSSVVDCYTVIAMIKMKAKGGGIVECSLQLEFDCTQCSQNSTRTIVEENSVQIVKDVVSGIIVVLCVTSLLMVAANAWTSFVLAKAMRTFYKTQLGIDLSWSDCLPIFSRGHIFNIFGDLITITGTIMKIILDYSSCLLTPSSSIQTSMVRILLGTGILLQAAVMLRFVSYFQQFNAVFRALKIAAPRLGKYILCALLLFLAFMMCGWLVLSPYHYKFMNFGESFHALYTMMHGDDLYITYQAIRYDDDPEAYVFSQFFFTIFLMLFIYAMLNLMISLIMESYEESQNEELSTKNEVRKFVYSGPLTPGGVALKDVTAVKKYVEPAIIKQRKDVPDHSEVEMTV